MATYTKFYFRPGKGEQINATVTPEADGRSAICGKVLDPKGRPVPDALALLFRAPEGEAPVPEGRCCTDEDGHFLFGPLQSEALYIIKVYKNDTKIRELEVVAE
ncbi:MAG: hypothetical protein FWC62_05340 [Firmicutes bacterium]|nr:hypothetical protein [Bacillota bacterium]